MYVKLNFNNFGSLSPLQLRFCFSFFCCCFLSFCLHLLTSLFFLAGVKASAADKSAPGDDQATGESFQVGERVWVNGNKPGYVQFLGETQFAPGQWAGIVLDEPIGKNDGSVAGIRYFQCEALRGIFTRPSKLSRTEGEANGTQTAPASRAASPTPSIGSVTSHALAKKSALPTTSTTKKPATTVAATPASSSNLARTNSESVSNLSESGSVKKGERELKIGDRVLVNYFSPFNSVHSFSIFEKKKILIIVSEN